jgi:hypothetical protein
MTNGRRAVNESARGRLSRAPRIDRTFYIGRNPARSSGFSY